MDVKSYFVKNDARCPIIALLVNGDRKYVSFTISTVCSEVHNEVNLFFRNR